MQDQDAGGVAVDDARHEGQDQDRDQDGARRSADDASRRNAQVLVAFTAVTNLTDGVTKVALPLIASSLTQSPALVSLVLFTMTLPWLLISLHVGVLVDRADRRRLLWAANVLRVAAVGVLVAATASGAIGLPLLFACAAVLGVAEVVALTSASALVPDAIAPAGRERVNAVMTGVETVSNEFVGPFAGGLLVAAGASLALGVSAGGYLAATALLPLLVGRFKVVRAAGRPPVSVNRQIGEGLRFLWRQRLLRTLSLSVAVLVTCWAAWFALMPLVATRVWGLSPTGYGALVGALGVGGLVGTLVVGHVNRLLGRRWAMFANIFAAASMVAVPAVTANVWASGAAAFLGGLGSTLWVVNARTIGQSLVEPGMMGRFSAASRLFGWGSLPLGSAAAGALAQAVGYRVAFGVFTAAAVVVVVPFLRALTPEALDEVEARLRAQ
ncbi:MFS transporter [Actinomadura harenae]|uniref:MFS transporter n=1 Tax=Actinomadura harenae TaxID=2483351 RepID=A0A3M2MFU2_9ACTN|nr:MFS transporter [Actinomadura harenae]RMI47850.1 MFS transporter [Actinomadura harenae]